MGHSLESSVLEQKKDQFIWKAIVNPARSVEVRVWVKRSPVQAQELRGAYQEGIMHWACMSDMGLVIDLLSLGFDVNACDQKGETPWDWLTDRFWMGCVLDQANLPMEGRSKIKAQTEDVGIVAWQHGARPGKGREVSSVFHGTAWVRGGAWGLVEAIFRSEGLSGLKGWPVQAKTALHDWILAEESPGKHEQIVRWLGWGLKIDEVDQQGRTPLWYAVDAWMARPQYLERLRPTIQRLIALGADPDREDDFGVSPRMVFLNYEGRSADALHFESWAASRSDLSL